METTERQAGDVTILDARGRLMFGDGEDDFRLAINRLLDADRVKIVINMAEVPFVDSAGLSQLVRTFVTTGKRDGGMKLVGLSTRVRELLTITRLLTVFKAFDSEEEAVASFGNAADGQ